MADKKKTKEIELGDLIPLIISENQLIKEGLARELLIDIRFEDKIIGPLKKEDVEKYLDQKKIKSSKATVRSHPSGNWYKLFEHPFLERRNRGLVNEEDTLSGRKNQQYYLLTNGKKVGPYNSLQIDEKLSKHELLFTDEISINEGEEWVKIYQIEQFNRRRKTEDKLPPPPTSTFFSKEEALINKKAGKNAPDENEAVSTLASLGHYNKPGSNISSNQNGIEKKNESKFKLKLVAIFGILFVALLLGAFFSYKNYFKEKYFSEKKSGIQKRKSVKPFRPKKLKRSAKRRTSPRKAKRAKRKVKTKKKIEKDLRNDPKRDDYQNDYDNYDDYDDSYEEENLYQDDYQKKKKRKKQKTKRKSRKKRSLDEFEDEALSKDDLEIKEEPTFKDLDDGVSSDPDLLEEEFQNEDESEGEVLID